MPSLTVTAIPVKLPAPARTYRLTPGRSRINVTCTGYMHSLSWSQGSLTRRLRACALILWPLCALGAPSEPEDSPLYAASRQRALADMADHDRGLWAGVTRQGAGGIPPGAVIVLEGARWRVVEGAPPVQGRPGSGTQVKNTLQPRGVTTDLSCTAPTMCTTCQYTSCGATCETGATCWGSYTCHGITCYSPSCSGPTCSEPTCWGVSCSLPGPTCFPPPTCGVTACGATCLGTCAPEVCPTSLTDVQVPQPGVIQMSFMASSALRYTLLSCTNLIAGPWAAVSTVANTQGTVTLSHTNPAPVAFYRLLVQTP